MVLDKFKYDDPDTNMGLVVSPMMNYKYRDETSIKLCVFPCFEEVNTHKPVFFTCDGKAYNISVNKITSCFVVNFSYI